MFKMLFRKSAVLIEQNFELFVHKHFGKQFSKKNPQSWKLFVNFFTKVELQIIILDIKSHWIELRGTKIKVHKIKVHKIKVHKIKKS